MRRRGSGHSGGGISLWDGREEGSSLQVRPWREEYAWESGHVMERLALSQALGCPTDSGGGEGWGAILPEDPVRQD